MHDAAVRILGSQFSLGVGGLVGHCYHRYPCLCGIYIYIYIYIYIALSIAVCLSIVLGVYPAGYACPPRGTRNKLFGDKSI